MKKLSIITILLSIVLFSCGEDDEPEDFRLKVVGDYTYASTIVFYTDPSQVFTETGTLKVELQGSSGLLLIFDPGTSEEVELVCSAVEASNGVGFTINNKTIADPDGDNFILSGIGTFNLEGVDYDGFYDTGRNQIEFSAEIDYVDNQYDDYNYAMTVLATKK